MSKVLLRFKLALGGLVLSFLTLQAAQASPFRVDRERASADVSSPSDDTFVAQGSSTIQLFNAISTKIGRPVIVSELAGTKRVSGNFDLKDPQQQIEHICNQIGLISYDDGTSVYVYDVSEMENKMVILHHASFLELIDFLHSTGLYNKRYAPRSNGNSGTFYISGPPTYIEIVVAAAKYIDQNHQGTDMGGYEVRVIHLRNTFVTDRTYKKRDKDVNVPGVANVLNQLLNEEHIGGAEVPGATISIDSDIQKAVEEENSYDQKNGLPTLPSLSSIKKINTKGPLNKSGPVKIIAYQDNNSLLIKGSSQQVNYVEKLVNTIDVPKQQIDFSLWIVDVSKDDVDQLGIKWQGVAQSGNLALNYNSSTLTSTDQSNFLANVSGLVNHGNAQVVAHPELLTQENIPALFDNSSSFYARLVGERTASLQKITYGTQISVLPRLARGGSEIEMMLDIEDGGAATSGSDDGRSEVDSLPVVNSTQISTQARVPRGSSLLVGGYTREQNEHSDIGIPLLKDIPYLGRLFDYHYTRHKDYVRLFLLQPKVLNEGEVWSDTAYHSGDTVLGKQGNGQNVTVQSTVNMLRGYMSHRK